jgi:hypothetical protein
MINVYDIESFEEKMNVIPYCVCFLYNNVIYDIYGTDKIIIKSFEKILSLSKEFYIEFYTHNLNFDGMIILNEISKSKIIFKLIHNKTNIYAIDIMYLNKKIRFRCSYKLLPISLKKIGIIEKFNKTTFPYKFVNRLTLEYIGKIPDKIY